MRSDESVFKKEKKERWVLLFFVERNETKQVVHI